MKLAGLGEKRRLVPGWAGEQRCGRVVTPDASPHSDREAVYTAWLCSGSSVEDHVHGLFCPQGMMQSCSQTPGAGPGWHTSQPDFRKEPSTGLSLKTTGWVSMGHVERFPKQLKAGVTIQVPGQLTLQSPTRLAEERSSPLAESWVRKGVLSIC